MGEGEPNVEPGGGLSPAGFRGDQFADLSIEELVESRWEKQQGVKMIMRCQSLQMRLSGRASTLKKGNAL